MPLIPLEPIQDRVIVKRTETGSSRFSLNESSPNKGGMDLSRPIQ